MQHVTWDFIYTRLSQEIPTRDQTCLTYYHLSLKQNILMRARLVNFQVLINNIYCRPVKVMLHGTIRIDDF